MVLSDVIGSTNKIFAGERWLSHRRAQAHTAARCIFAPPGAKRPNYSELNIQHEIEMERQRFEFVARYDPVGLTHNERLKFYDGLMNTSSPNPHKIQKLHHHRPNNDHNMKIDQQHHQQHQQRSSSSSFGRPKNEKK